MTAQAALTAEDPDATQAAQDTLEAEAHKLDAIGDPSAGLWRAMAQTLGAQQHLLTDATKAIESAKQPVDTDVLASAIRDGIRAHAGAAVRALNWRNLIAASTALMVAVAVGFAGGWLVSENRMVTVPELSGAIRASDAAAWTRVINSNPDIARCKPLRIDNPSGEACAVWIKVPGVN